MDFKSILNKLDSMEAPVATPAAPVLEKPVQLNEDAELRVLAGQSTYIAEAKKAKPDYLDFDKDGNKEEPMKKALKDKEHKTDEAVEEVFDADAKVGATKKTASGGTATKTATGLVHKGKKYGGEEEKSDDDEDEPKAKKAKKESIDTEAFAAKFESMVAEKKKPSAGMTKKEKSAVVKKAKAGGDIGKKGKGFEKVEKAAKKGGAKDPKAVAAAAMWKQQAKESVTSTKQVFAESVEQKLTFKQMVQLVQESGGQQQIDPKDKELFAWAERVASAKFTESTKAELYAGLVYERMGGVFEMYDVLSENKE